MGVVVLVAAVEVDAARKLGGCIKHGAFNVGSGQVRFKSDSGQTTALKSRHEAVRSSCEKLVVRLKSAHEEERSSFGMLAIRAVRLVRCVSNGRTEAVPGRVLNIAISSSNFKKKYT